MIKNTVNNLKKTSKFLSLILRHRPEVIGLQLDPQGWANIEELLAKMNAHQHAIDRGTLEQVVRENNKQRFSISKNGLSIRANQGHSINIQLGLCPLSPPSVLYHGTAIRNLGAIKEMGLLKMNRQHVHLSGDGQTAKAVGSRHGKPLVLQIDAKKMASDGHLFYCSENGVWLSDHVPPIYIDFGPNVF